ncbi:MAG: GtrA family protein [candidate division SR1 bacterium]|nr:GtrA family protein [candidate division SR1 bacterium]
MSKTFMYKVIRFGINGVVMTIGTYVLIKLLMALSLGYIFASIISTGTMILVNYLTSTRFVFKSKKSWESAVHFLVSQGLAFLVFNAVNYAFFTSGFNKNYCFIAAMMCSILINFVYNNFITFRK